MVTPRSTHAHMSLLTMVLSFALTVSVQAQNKSLMQCLQEDPTRLGCNMHGYEFHDYTYTPAPKGYTAFYISHYGRHGSRSSWGEPDYKHLATVLQDAQQQQNLTPKGEELLAKTLQVLQLHNGMTGRLTDKGEREHAQLATRMYQRWPEVFTRGNGQIRSISSEVQRCLISMCAFTNQLTRINPKLQYNFDVGKQFQRYIDCAGKLDDTPQWHVIDSLSALIPDDTEAVFNKLFVRAQDARAKYNVDSLQHAIYETCIVMQDFDIPANMFDYMGEQAAYKREVRLMLNLFVRFGNNPGVIEQRRPFVQLGLNDFIQRADEVIQKGNFCADLRFGHDIPLMTMMATMGISGVGTRMLPQDVEKQWFGFANICMASNIQMAFYRPKHSKHPKDEEILVKILYNEKERTVAGLQPEAGVFYRWSDLKKKWSGPATENLPWQASF